MKQWPCDHVELDGKKWIFEGSYVGDFWQFCPYCAAKKPPDKVPFMPRAAIDTVKEVLKACQLKDCDYDRIVERLGRIEQEDCV